MNVDDTLTVGAILTKGAAWLTARGVEDAVVQAEWLASAYLHVGRAELGARLGDVADADFTDSMRSAMVRIANGEPIQYVLGEWDFRFLTLKTDRRALIPRPETEQLVSLVLAEPDVRAIQSPVICDVGTGTGCIAISLALEMPSSKCVAIDVDEGALSLARENARRCGASIEFRHGRNLVGFGAASIDVVVSNPPYIDAAEMEALPGYIRDHEPRVALYGGVDGLDVIRSLVNDAAITLRRGGWCFLEIGDGQGEQVRGILEDAGFSQVSILNDFAGLDRYAKARIV